MSSSSFSSTARFTHLSDWDDDDDDESTRKSSIHHHSIGGREMPFEWRQCDDGIRGGGGAQYILHFFVESSDRRASRSTTA